MTQYAYVRVSTKEQNVDRQLRALEEYHLDPKNIYVDHQSGKDFDRPAYQRLIATIRQGDVLFVKSIDRLGRNYNEILEQWQYITKKINADIVVLDMSMLDTRKKDGNLTGTFIADLVLQILAYVAQNERESIRQRQAEGIAAAKARGMRFGREPMKMPPGFEECCARRAAGEITLQAAAAELGLSYTTFYRRYQQYIKEHEKELNTSYKIKHGDQASIFYPAGRPIGQICTGTESKDSSLRFRAFHFALRVKWLGNGKMDPPKSTNCRQAIPPASILKREEHSTFYPGCLFFGYRVIEIKGLVLRRQEGQSD